MGRGFFVTGTDTGVGKTIVAAALVGLLNRTGIKTGVMKPIESGCVSHGDLLTPSDGNFLRAAASMNEPLSMVTPCCLSSPLAPMVASEMDGIPISLHEIRDAFLRLSEIYDAMVVEGIGGLLVPIVKGYFVADLIRELGLPLIIVARPGLGTINHVLLTVKHALREGLAVAGVILNHTSPPGQDLAERTNPDLLRRVCPIPLLGIFPYIETTKTEDLVEAAQRSLVTDVLLSFFRKQ